MARTTESTFLMHGTGTGTTTYAKLVDIKEFPDLGSAPDTIDVTTLSDHMKHYLNDLIDPGSLEFNCNYDKDDYEKLYALAGKKGEKYSVWMGEGSDGQPDGHEGKFDFTGELSVWVKGGSVSASTDMGVAIAPSSDITLVTA